MLVVRPLRVRFIHYTQESLAGIQEILNEYPNIGPTNIEGEFAYHGMTGVSAPIDAANFYDTVQSCVFSIDEYVVGFAEMFSVMFGLKFEIYCGLMESFYAIIRDAEEPVVSRIPAPADAVKGELLRFLSPATSLPILRERPKGVKLLSAALNARTPGSQIVEFVRLFELAFNSKHSALQKPLQAFLDAAKISYYRDFAKRIIYLRHRLSHAHARIKPSFDPDARTLVPVARQAGYDVLLNKSVWGTRDASRRSTNMLSAYTSDGNNMTVWTGSQIQLQFGSSEYYGRFPSMPSNPQGLTAFDIAGLARALKEDTDSTICGFFGLSGYHRL